MTINEYQELAMRTASKDVSKQDALLNSVLLYTQVAFDHNAQ